jgi:hypothetical protein
VKISTDSRIRLRTALVLTGLVGAGLVSATPVFAWGHTGHAMTNRLACDCLPEGPLKTFFKTNQEYVSKHAIDPDIFKRKHHAEEGPRHFLNIDAQGTKPEDYPREWKGAVEKFGAHAATKQGKLPWAMKEVFDSLVAAFKAKDGPKIIETATWLGHYVGDCNQPFHACTNHDGADTGQKGIHSVFESQMLDHNEDEIAKAAAALAAKMEVAEVADVISYAFTTLTASDKLAHEILAKDKGNRASGREKALFKAVGPIAEERIASGATGLASLWLTAWIKAGSPELPKDFKLPEGVAPEPGHADEE